MFNYFLILILMIFLGACGPSIPDDFFQSPYGNYSQAAVNYFLEIGFCPEFGTCASPVIKRWNSGVRIQIHGAYNSADEAELNSIISELSELTRLSITRVTSNANINIYFVKHSDFKRYISSYNESNAQEGLFATVYDQSSKFIVRAVICIENGLTEKKKHHLLREELTQTFGLQRDSYRYQNSIFQQDPRYMPTEYLSIDKEVIRILYDNRLRAGMRKEQVKSALTVPVGQQLAGN